MMLRDRTNIEINKITESYMPTSEITTIISYSNLLPTTRLHTYPLFQFTFTNFSYYYIVSNKAFRREPSERDSNARKNIDDSSSVGSMPIIPCVISCRLDHLKVSSNSVVELVRCELNATDLRSSAVDSIILELRKFDGRE